MLVAVSPLVIEIAAWSGAVVAVGGAVRFLTGWSISRFVARRLVLEPVESGVRKVVEDSITPRLEEIRSELDYNGGRTVKDIVRATAEQVETIWAQQQVMTERMDAIEHIREQNEEIQRLAESGRVERRKS